MNLSDLIKINGDALEINGKSYEQVTYCKNCPYYDDKKDWCEANKGYRGKRDYCSLPKGVRKSDQSQ